MKILNIHFKNINSLEGENRINFEQAPFSGTGVFAITGPNGSGKSSILDAITLGLYGETFRFDRPAAYVMTKNTASCFAEIEFSLGGEKYQSSWHVQRTDGKPGNELLPPEMQLIRLRDGEVLANTHRDACARITEITGMNFRNFTRSILLAQGDFAAFLNALDSERMDILEKIISTDIYADYKKEVMDRAENAQKELDRLQRDLAAIQLMEPEKQEACEHDLSDFKEQLAELREEQNTLKQQQSAQEKTTDLQRQIVAQKRELKEAREQAQNVQATLDRLAAGQDALLFKDDVEAINEKHRLIHEGKSALDDLQGELKQLKHRLGDDKTAPDNVAQRSFSEQQQTLDAIRARVNELSLNGQAETAHEQSLAAQCAEKRSVLATVSGWMEEHADDALLLTDFPELDKLKKLRGEVAELSGKQASFTKQSKKTLSILKNNAAALDKEHKRQSDLKHQLATEEKELETLARGNTLDEIDALGLEQKERGKDFQTLFNLAQKYRQLTGGSGFFSLFKRKEQPEHDVDALAVKLEQLRLEIKREENIKRVLEETIIRETLLKKMAPDRHHLVDGKPCPLCGALQHPYAKRPPAPGNSRQALIDQKAKIRSVMEKATTTGTQISLAHKQSEKNQGRRIQLRQMREQWLNLCNRLNIVSDDLDITKLGLMKELARKEADELTTIVRFAAQYRKKQAGIEKLKVLIAKSATLIEQLQARTQQLGSNTEGLTQEQIDIEAALAHARREEKQLADKVLEQLTLLGQKMPAKGQEDALSDLLTARKRDYHGYDFRQKALTEELAALEAKLTACQAEITRCNEQLEIYGGQLQTEETLGLHLALIEKQKLIVGKEQWLTRQEAETAALDGALEEKIRPTPFTSRHEISEMLELTAHRPELERQKAELEQAIDAKTIALEAAIVQLDAYLEAPLDPKEIEERLKRGAEQMEIARLEALHLEQLLEVQKQHQQNREAVLLQLQQQEAAARPHLAEAELIAAESGMALRRRVQERIAGQLLSQTNALLEKISGRYYLRQAPSEQGLALEIEDTYQANARRLPKTLSGGESFVVSLALALGLSELANNGRSVDSLFLDEGFGNLDAESLYTVITTLEGLHAHGKTVGVISHVDAVQKRIKAQLQVVKKPNGMGELRKAS